MLRSGFFFWGAAFSTAAGRVGVIAHYGLASPSHFVEDPEAPAGTNSASVQRAAVRRPLAPALQRLIMSSAPMRNDGTYDMTEQERLAQRARYLRITGAAQPAAVPPPAADDARSATAGNGAHASDARIPAPNADTSDADAPTPPPADTSARSALLRSRSPPARIERTRNQRHTHTREGRHRILLELLAYEEGPGRARAW